MKLSMQYAITRARERVAPAPGLEGFCPICEERLIPRCGEIVVWHWAHEKSTDCDPWWEPETEWHRSWKGFASTDRVEVAMGEHRADIVSHDGRVIELQHSSIDPEQIRSREAFYKRMVWLIDGQPFLGNLRVEIFDTQCRFVWAHARPSWFSARMPRFVHSFMIGTHLRTLLPEERRLRRVWNPTGVSSNIFQILSLSTGRQIEGTGRIIEFDRFVERLIR